eukprot:scaffold1007_cov176-Amphora_coffeaeformis.AAC.27
MRHAALKIVGIPLVLMFFYVCKIKDTPYQQETTVKQVSNIRTKTSSGHLWEPSSQASQPPQKPWLVWHVGPPKTGTSTIQTMLEQFNNSQPLVLAADGYTYDHWDDIRESHLVTLLKTPALNRPKATSSKHKNNKNKNPWDRYVGRMQDLAHNGTHVILSKEGLARSAAVVHGKSYTFVDRVIQELGPSFRFAVIITYRRLFDYLYSLHNQMYKRTDDVQNTQWPGEAGGRRHDTFAEFVQTCLDDPTWADKCFPTEYALSSFRNKVDFLHVINFHEGDLPASFFCHALPAEAPRTCQQVIRSDSSSSSSPPADGEISGPLVVNPSTPLVQYDLLATAAYTRGWIHGKRWDRGSITESIWEYHERQQKKTLTDFPLLCPSTVLMKRLLERSILTEQAVLSGLEGRNEKLLREHFQTFVAAKKHCSIDVDTVLQEAEWKEFFRQFQ